MAAGSVVKSAAVFAADATVVAGVDARLQLSSTALTPIALLGQSSRAWSPLGSCRMSRHPSGKGACDTAGSRSGSRLRSVSTADS